MDTQERQELAETRAERYAPAPTGGALMAGVCVAVVALVGDFIVSGFYGWEVRRHPILAAVLGVAGFLIGWLTYLRLARANRKAARAERHDIDVEQDGA